METTHVVLPSPSKTALRRGWARQQEIAAQAEAERQQEAAALVAALGHEPNAIERTVIEQISARTVRARQLRRNGRDDTELSRLIAQLLRSIGMKPAPAASKPTDPRANAVEWLNSFKKPSNPSEAPA
jgi:hypothetical protein